MYKYFQGDVTYWLGPQKLFLDSKIEKKIRICHMKKL